MWAAYVSGENVKKSIFKYLLVKSLVEKIGHYILINYVNIDNVKYEDKFKIQ